MTQKTSLRPAIAAFLLMVAMAITTSALSFFVSPICSELNIGRGSFLLYYSLMTAAGAFSITFVGNYVSKKGVHKILVIAGIWCACGLFLFSFANSLWMFYIVAACMGFFATSSISLCANVIVQTSYSDEQAASLLGFVAAGSGVGGMIFSLILPNIIENFGWRIGYRFLAVCWLVFVFAAFFLMGKQEIAENSNQRRTLNNGMTRAEAVKSPKFYLILVSIIMFTIGSGVQQQLPSYLESMNFSTGQISFMISLMTASLAIGKILQGMLYNRIGIKNGGIIIGMMYVISFLLLQKSFFAYPGLICLAFGMGILTTLMPTVVRYIFGAREFAAIWGLISTVCSVSSFIATPSWGMVYDSFGTYTPAMMACPVLLVIGLITMSISLKDLP